MCYMKYQALSFGGYMRISGWIQKKHVNKKNPSFLFHDKPSVATILSEVRFIIFP